MKLMKIRPIKTPQFPLQLSKCVENATKNPLHSPYNCQIRVQNGDLSDFYSLMICVICQQFDAYKGPPFVLQLSKVVKLYPF